MLHGGGGQLGKNGIVPKSSGLTESGKDALHLLDAGLCELHQLPAEPHHVLLPVPARDLAYLFQKLVDGPPLGTVRRGDREDEIWGKAYPRKTICGKTKEG